MLLFFLILMEAGLGQGGCPDHCTCTTNAVTCVQQLLEVVPSFNLLENEPLIIDLSGNHIALVDADDFSFINNQEVKEIYLNGTNLVSIEPETFDELFKLQELYLSNNLLSVFPEDMLIFNKALIVLDLSENRFIEFPKINSSSLEVLALIKNGLQTINDDVLQGLPNLQTLFLQENNLQFMDEKLFDNLPHLSIVHIEFNPWKCNCDTIELFRYMIKKKILETNKSLQCATVSDEKVFIDILDDKGFNGISRKLCLGEYVNNISTNRTTERSVLVLKSENQVLNLNDTNGVTIVVDFNRHTHIILIVLISVWFFILGIGLGAYFTFTFMKTRVRKLKSSLLLLPYAHA